MRKLSAMTLELNEDQVAALASGSSEAKHEETQEEAEADSTAGRRIRRIRDGRANRSWNGRSRRTHPLKLSELSEEEVEEVEAGRAANRAEFAATWSRTRRTRRNDGEHEMANTSTPNRATSKRKRFLRPRANRCGRRGSLEEDVNSPPGETRAPRVGA